MHGTFLLFHPALLITFFFQFLKCQFLKYGGSLTFVLRYMEVVYLVHRAFFRLNFQFPASNLSVLSSSVVVLGSDYIERLKSVPGGVDSEVFFCLSLTFGEGVFERISDLSMQSKGFTISTNLYSSSSISGTSSLSKSSSASSSMLSWTPIFSRSKTS